MGELLQFVNEEDNLLFVIYDRVFSTVTKKNHHSCKGSISSNNLVYVALRHVIHLIKDRYVDFIDTTLLDSISNSGSSDETQELENVFACNLDRYLMEQFC